MENWLINIRDSEANERVQKYNRILREENESLRNDQERKTITMDLSIKILSNTYNKIFVIAEDKFIDANTKKQINSIFKKYCLLVHPDKNNGVAGAVFTKLKEHQGYFIK